MQKNLPFILILLFAVIICSSFAEDKFPLKVGDMEVDYAPLEGLRLSVFGTSVIGSSSIVVVSPTWVIEYYKTNNMPNFPDNITIEDIENGKRIVIKHISPKENTFEGTQTITLLENNMLKNEMEMTLLKDVPAIIEWKVGAINPLPIIGNTFVASDDELTTQGSIPMKAKSGDVNESMVARSFKTLQIDSRLGTMTIKTDPELNASFFDYRKNQWADITNPIFWFGLLGRPIQANKKYEYSFEFQFPEKRYADNIVEEKEFSPEIREVPNALRPHWGDDVVLPEPKDLNWTRSRLMLEKNVKIYVPEGMKNALSTSLDFLTGDLKKFYNISSQIVEIEKSKDVSDHIIAIASPGRDFPGFPTGSVKPPDHPEGYSVLVDNDRVAVVANNPRGLFYGVTSLLQMIRVRDNEMYIQGGRITDYPTLDFRGVHCLSGKNAGDEIAKAIKNLMARFKMNSMVWECQYIIWDSHPEIEHEEYGMKKSEAKKVIAAAETYFMELIPLVQSLGHSKWIFTNKQNLDIAEDPETPYAYNPTNPKTYEFIFSVYQEAVDLFQPVFFHIGHDEVTMRGRFPWRSKDSGKSVTELLLDDVKKLNEWFAERDIRIMLWGDMFLWKGEASSAAFAESKEEAQKRRDGLPKDAFISDWHYEAIDPAKYTSLKIFNEEGFKVCGASWYNPENIRNLTLSCKMYDVAGLLQTTWAGFNFRIDNHQEAWFQYWAYLWAAWYSWSGSDTEVNDLPFLAPQTFLDIWSERKPVLENKKGFMINLDQAANCNLDDNDKRSGWIGMGPDYDINLPVQDFMGEVRFDIARYKEEPGALLMAGNLNPKGEFPKKVAFDLKEAEADEIHFLITAAFRNKDGAPSGEIIMEYADGKTEKIELIYGKNFFNFQDARVGPETRIAWWEKQNEEIHCLHDLIWKNPSPEKKIKSITVKSYVTDSAPALVAVTGVRNR